MRKWQLAIAAILSASLPLSSMAQKPPVIPVETFMKRAEFTAMSISPKGDRLAALSPYKDRDNLVVIDLTNRTRKVITAFEKYDVVAFNWVNNDRIFLRVADGKDALGRITYLGTFAVDIDGSNLRDLTNLRGLAPARSLPGDTEGEMLVTMSERNRYSRDLYKLNTKTGRYSLLTFDSPGEVGGWVLDWDRVARVTSTTDLKTGESTVWYRDNADSKWEALFTNPDDSAADNIDPIAFDGDNKTLIVASNVGRDKYALYKYDPKAKKLGELIFEHPLIDINGGLIFNRAKRTIAGISYNADVRKTLWLDPKMAELQKQIDATLKNTTNVLSFNPDSDNGRILITSYSDTDPGRTYLFDAAQKSLEPLPPHRPWIKPEDISPRKFITYTARDGLKIPAWVTIPKGTDGKNLPLIVNIHGGPNARVYGDDPWSRYSEAPFFANRGYVVLEPEPRASTGFGRKHLQLGYKQWGGTMQDDLTDGVLHLIKEGIVDKNRVCLYGGSYGGYATLQGLVKEPEMFRCGLPWIAVVDLVMMQTQMTSDTNNTRFNVDVFYNRNIGNRDTERAMLEKNSPVNHADRIKAPVLLVMGSDDVRVPLKHGTDMRAAMEKAGVKHELVIYKAEAHGFNKQENVVDFFTRAEKFFAENLK
jgi:dipeptidyl aminopeptidase/acylaminoacyl peptidase